MLLKLQEGLAGDMPSWAANVTSPQEAVVQQKWHGHLGIERGNRRPTLPSIIVSDSFCVCH